jgi:hypothetical protein
VEWTATMNSHEEEHDFRENGGRVVQDISSFDQTGRARGMIQFGGKKILRDEENWWEHRQHTPI